MLDLEKVIYFDNAATTKMCEEAVDTYIKYATVSYANVSSSHSFGFEVSKEVDELSKEVFEILKVNKNEIIWTSGATESNNFAIRKGLYANKQVGKHIITSKIEHASVINVCKELEKEGYEISFIDVDGTGHFNLESLEKLIRPDTALVSLMYVNNEIGSIQDIEKIGNIIKSKNKRTLFHTDATQGFMKYDIDFKKGNIDLLSVSAHKIHGPKGVGFLYVKDNINLSPFILGGGQQNNMRSGTINVSVVMAFLESIKMMSKIDKTKIKNLHKYFYESLLMLKNKYEFINILSKNDDTFSSYIVSVSFEGIRSEVLMRDLSMNNIYVSAGSSCSSKIKNKVHTLEALSLNENIIDSNIRFSFSHLNTKEEIDILMNVLDKDLSTLKKFIRK